MPFAERVRGRPCSLCTLPFNRQREAVEYTCGHFVCLLCVEVTLETTTDGRQDNLTSQPVLCIKCEEPRQITLPHSAHTGTRLRRQAWTAVQTSRPVIQLSARRPLVLGGVDMLRDKASAHLRRACSPLSLFLSNIFAAFGLHLCASTHTLTNKQTYIYIRVKNAVLHAHYYFNKP